MNDSTIYRVTDYTLTAEENIHENRVFNYETAVEFSYYSSALEYAKKAEKRGCVGASLEMIIVGEWNPPAGTNYNPVSE